MPKGSCGTRRSACSSTPSAAMRTAYCGIKLMRLGPSRRWRVRRRSRGLCVESCRRDFSGTYRHNPCLGELMTEQRTPLKDKDILLAVEDCRRLERILSGHRLTIPHSVEEAKLDLERRQLHMVILGVLFDESRMFELLRLVRTFDKNRLTPVVCVLATESRLSSVAIEGLDHA